LRIFKGKKKTKKTKKDAEKEVDEPPFFLAQKKVEQLRRS
jgi:hypothetical protein